MGMNYISLMEAYLIETVRASGITNQELEEHVSKKDVTPWEDLNQNLQFQALIDLQEKDPVAFHSIIRDGYQVKFVTMNGLKNLLKLKFDITETEYEPTEKGITKLVVDVETLSNIKQVLSPNWKVQVKAPDGENVNKEISITLGE
ncbi:hypothetical protein ACDX78_15850 [Virgibacillus oceani]